MRWPTSARYLAETYPVIRRTLTSTNIQISAFARLFFPSNWRYFGSRPNLVARAIYMDWRVREKLHDLPTSPVWSINCTAAENGRRFRFKDGRLGDYESGYAQAGKFPLASAMATSAAFPVGIGPFRLYAKRFDWVKRPTWDSKHEEPIEPMFDEIHLYDGGVYDNLGLEPFFDAGKGNPKIKHRIVVSDAGAPLDRGFGLSSLNPFRIKRLMDVMMDQNRALRVRGFIEFLLRTHEGAYLGIARTASLRSVMKRSPDDSMSEDLARYVTNFPTSLLELSKEDFDVIARHGYETAKFTQAGFPYLP
jgi:NTE family protein